MNVGSKILFSSLATIALCIVPLPAQGNGGGGGNNGLLASYIQSLPLENVDAAELAELNHMRQEEKLARDVYLVLSQTWAIPAFANIAQAEQEHMDLVKLMLDRYGIADPLPSDQIGVYRDQIFVDLFNLLTNFGLQSQLHAEIVGAVIEDLDIADLDHSIAVTDNRDIGTVWQNLLRGSRNHMRAFYGLLDARGIVYPGFFITFARIQAIVSTPVENIPVDENGNPLR